MVLSLTWGVLGMGKFRESINPSNGIQETKIFHLNMRFLGHFLKITLKIFAVSYVFS